MIDDRIRRPTAIDQNSPIPFYFQLKLILLDLIKSGAITPGEALPSEREIEEKYGVSRITVRRALGDLANEGYVDRQIGRGTFVLPLQVHDKSGKLGGLFEDLTAQGFAAKSEILESERTPAPETVAQRLNLDAGHPLLHIKRLVLADGKPVSVASGYFNVGAEITFTKEELATDSIFAALEVKYGIFLRRAEKTLEATAASGDEASLLEIEAGMPVLLSKVTVYDEQGYPAAFFTAVYRSDRYKYRCTLTR